MNIFAKMSPAVVVLLTVFILPVVLSHKIPDELKRCHISEANFDNCLQTTIEDAIKLIGTSGIASINLPPIEPLEVARMEIGAGSKAVHLVQKFENLKIYGISKSTVDNAHLDLDNKVLTFTMFTPEYINKGKYTLEGKLLLLPVHGTGNSVITFFGVKATHTLQFKEEMKSNKKYFKLVTYRLEMSMTKLHYQLDNLFDGNKQLSDNIHKVINENWSALYQDVQEGAQNVYAEIYKNIAKRLFDNIPVDEIFLP